VSLIETPTPALTAPVIVTADPPWSLEWYLHGAPIPPDEFYPEGSNESLTCTIPPGTYTVDEIIAYLTAFFDTHPSYHGAHYLKIFIVRPAEMAFYRLYPGDPEIFQPSPLGHVAIGSYPLGGSRIDGIDAGPTFVSIPLAEVLFFPDLGPYELGVNEGYLFGGDGGGALFHTDEGFDYSNPYVSHYSHAFVGDISFYTYVEDEGGGGGGGAGDGAGMMSGDRIDELRISRVARTAEEIRQVHRRLFVYTRWAQELVHSLQPPGVYSQDPDSLVQRLYAVGADALATGWALIEELLEDFLPDRATRTLSEWEVVTGLLPRPHDTVAQRRARVLAFLRKIHGYSRASIADAIAPVLGLTAADLVFTEGRNRIADDFTGASVHGRWTQRPGGGVVAVAAGALTLSFAIAADARWATSPRIIMSLVDPGGAEIYVQVTALSIGNVGDVTGLVYIDPSTADGTVFGLRWNGTEYDFVHVTIQGAVETTTMLASGASLPVVLRVREVAGAVELYHSSGFDGPWVQLGGTHVLVGTPLAAGLVLIGEDASAAAASSASFGEFRVWMPQSRQVFQWWVSAAAGSPSKADLFAAQRLVNEMKPSHTRGTVIGTVFLTDDPDSLTDLDILGV
jgi:hypothetical protein